MKKYNKKFFLFTFLIVVLFLPIYILSGVTIDNPLGHDTFGELIHAIVSFIRNLALMIAPIIFIVAGLMYYFSGGNPDKAKQATDLIKWALVGLVIILIANGITAVVKDIMGLDDPYSLFIMFFV